MDDEEREHYIKLLTFTYGIALDVLHHYFEIRVLDKVEFFFFLDQCKHELFHALFPAVSCCKCRNGSIPFSKKPPTLYSMQFNLLFYIKKSTVQCLHNKTVLHCLCQYTASRSVTVNDLDISLVYAIINTCCPSIHGNLQWIKDVKDTRNFLSHKSNCRLTKKEYDTGLNTVEKAILNLANIVSSTFWKMIQKQISDFKKYVPSSNTVKDILASSNDDVCKRLESKIIQESKSMKNLVIQVSKFMSQEIINRIKEYKDELSIDINKLIFEVKTHICEQLRSQKIIGESGETRYATSTHQTAQPESTQSKNENKCRVEWKLATSDTWNVTNIKNTLEHLSGSLGQWFEIEFVYIGSLVIRTIVPEHILSNYNDFKSAVRSFLAKIVEVCQLDTDTPTVVKVDLSIFTEIPPSDSVPCYVCGKMSETKKGPRLRRRGLRKEYNPFENEREMKEMKQREDTLFRPDTTVSPNKVPHPRPSMFGGIYDRVLTVFNRKRRKIEEDDSDYSSGRMSSDFTRNRMMIEDHDSDYNYEIVSSDISRTSKFKKQMEKSMPKAQMEKTIDHGPFAFDISTIDDPMTDEQIEKREDVHPIHLKYDTNVPKSSRRLRSWRRKDKDDSISSTEKH